VNLRRLVTAGVAATVAVTTLTVAPELLASPTTADANGRERPGGDARQVLQTLTAFAGGAGPDHTDPLPKSVSPNAPVDTTSLYERAGLGTPRVARARLAAADDAAGFQARTAESVTPPGTPIVPGLSEHVPPSCTGTGSDGPRVQALYVHESDEASRFDSVLALLRHELANVDDVFAVSAAKTGGGRRVRWVHDGACVPVIGEVTVPDGALSGFKATVDALEARGLDRPDRKYLAFTDADLLCGIASYYPSSSKTDNPNDGRYPLHARVDTRCWSNRYTSVAAHELLHNLGGVQADAPHATAYGHCTDDSDLMCYDDGAGTEIRQVCPSDQEALLDCNEDDYFTTRERAGSYLAEHWNTADSSFLDVVPALGADPAPKPKVTTGWSATTASRGTPSAISARLTEPATGRTLGRMRVVLQVRWYGAQRWQRHGAPLFTARTGRATRAVRLDRAAYFRYRFAGGPRRAASVSRPVLVKVPTRLIDRTSQASHRVVRSRLTTAAGTNLRNTRVVLQRRLAGTPRWRTTLSRRTNRYGVVRVEVRARRGEAFRWVYRGSPTRHRVVGRPVVLRR